MGNRNMYERCHILLFLTSRVMSNALLPTHFVNLDLNCVRGSRVSAGESLLGIVLLNCYIIKDEMRLC